MELLPAHVIKGLKTLLAKRIDNEKSIRLDYLDISNCKAFTVGGYGHLVINLKGRQPEGTVEPGREYEELCKQLITSLKGFRNPDTNEMVIDDARMRDEVYSEYQENTPDIIITWARGYYHIGERELQFLGIQVDDEQLFTRHGWSGNHRPNGIFVLSGQNVKTTGLLKDARIIDLAPTILALLATPIPDDMDGVPLTATIEDEFLQQHAVQYSQASISGQTEQVYSEEEQKEVSDRLRALGYLE